MGFQSQCNYACAAELEPMWSIEIVKRHLWARIKKTKTCWIWTGGKTADGYGIIHYRGKRSRAHRIVYEILTGKTAPPSLVSDHLCRTPSCVNPEHLEFVTSAENVRRGYRSAPICRNGHPRSKKNLRLRVIFDPKRRETWQCRLCARDTEKRRLPRPHAARGRRYIG